MSTMSEPVQCHSAVGDYERMDAWLSGPPPPLPPGTEVDEYGWPVVDPHPDEEPDELL